MSIARSPAFSHLAIAASAWDSLMANTSPSAYRAGLFINAREHYFLHLVAHTWLIWHTLSSKKDLKKKRSQLQQREGNNNNPNRRLPLYSLRNTFYTLVELGSLVAWGSAAWHLMLS